MPALGRTALDPDEGAAVLGSPRHVGGAEGVAAPALETVDGGRQQRVGRSRVAQLPGDELLADRGEPRVAGHRVLPCARVEEAQVRVRAAARTSGKRLGHKGREEPFLAGDLLDAVLEAEGDVGAGHAASGGVVDLPLRARVLAVGRDDVDPVLAHLADDPLDRGHPRVPHRVEDLIALEQRLAGLCVEEVELGLHPHHRLVPELPGAFEHAGEDVARRGGERFAVGPLRVADESSRRFEPRHDRRS